MLLQQYELFANDLNKGEYLWLLSQGDRLMACNNCWFVHYLPA